MMIIDGKKEAENLRQEIKKEIDILKSKNIKVIDIYLGSGTTAIASHNLGCNFIGYEKDKNYFQIAQKRIDNNIRQLKIL